jgi:hypothetical protein
VGRAHHQWGQVRDTAPARELGAALAALRGRVPGRREGALDHVQRQLRQLQTPAGTGTRISDGAAFTRPT